MVPKSEKTPKSKAFDLYWLRRNGVIILSLKYTWLHQEALTAVERRERYVAVKREDVTFNLKKRNELTVYVL